MNPGDFKEPSAGKVVRSPDRIFAFVPTPLPPQVPLNWSLVAKLSEAERNLGELNGVAQRLPNPYLLINPFARKEAHLSSRIEGTQASLSDLFAFEVDERVEQRAPDVKEVRNYVDALSHGLKRLSDLPVCLRLVKELHEILLTDVRGDDKQPGRFRDRQNWIGTPGRPPDQARYVPPPVAEMQRALSEWERYVNKGAELPPLVRLALIHYQFEAIHPFIDGNGRIGRLLVPLLLCEWKLMSQPLLYLSGYFEATRSTYYDLLLSVSQTGNWIDWVSYFLEAMSVQAKDALDRSNKLLAIWQKYRDRVQKVAASAFLLRFVDELFESPYISAPKAKVKLDTTLRTAILNIEKLQKLGILFEITGKQRNRVYAAKEILKALE